MNLFLNKERKSHTSGMSEHTSSLVNYFFKSILAEMSTRTYAFALNLPAKNKNSDFV